MTVKKNRTAALIAILAAILLVIIIAANSFVFVYENRSVSINRLNKIETVYTEPGLKFKVPFLDQTVELPNDAMVYDLSPSDVLTVDKKAMTVSSYVVWKIVDPLRFLQSIGTINEAQGRIDVSVYNAVKNLISSMNQDAVISARGQELNESITNIVRDQMEEAYGIEIVDIQIKQFDLPEDNKAAVYTRMISERAQIAAQHNAEGREQAEMIKNSADKESVLLISQANAQAEQLRGEGESAYMSILAEAYETPERAEFYEFVRSLEALKISLAGDSTVILPLESPLLKFLVEN